MQMARFLPSVVSGVKKGGLGLTLEGGSRYEHATGRARRKKKAPRAFRQKGHFLIEPSRLLQYRAITALVELHPGASVPAGCGQPCAIPWMHSICWHPIYSRSRIYIMQQAVADIAIHNGMLFYCLPAYLVMYVSKKCGFVYAYSVPGCCSAVARH